MYVLPYIYTRNAPKVIIWLPSPTGEDFHINKDRGCCGKIEIKPLQETNLCVVQALVHL